MNDITPLQMGIMKYVKWWAETKKTTIPQKEIVLYMSSQGTQTYSTMKAIQALIHNGWIRKAWSENQKRTYYVMIRNITL